MIICVCEAMGMVWSGTYGTIEQIGKGNAILIMYADTGVIATCFCRGDLDI